MILKSNFTHDDLGNDIVECYFVDDNGLGTEKSMLLLDYINMLKGCTTQRVSKDWYQLGSLPKGYYNGYYSNENEKFVSIVVEKSKNLLSLALAGKTKNYHICFPKLLFVITANINSSSSLYCYALKDEIVTDESLLYAYPYGNVNFETGSVCMGGNNCKISTFKDFELRIEQFFSLSTANHYYTPGQNTSWLVELNVLAEKLKTYDAFPDEILIPNPKGFRVKDVVHKLK